MSRTAGREVVEDMGELEGAVADADGGCDVVAGGGSGDDGGQRRRGAGRAAVVRGSRAGAGLAARVSPGWAGPAFKGHLGPESYPDTARRSVRYFIYSARKKKKKKY